jgi:hypothetical protein
LLCVLLSVWGLCFVAGWGGGGGGAPGEKWAGKGGRGELRIPFRVRVGMKGEG